MSLSQSIVLAIAFALLFRFVVPYLFPSAVRGTLVVDPERMRRKKTDGDDDDGGKGAGDPFVVRNSGMSIWGGDHRSRDKAAVRRLNTDAKRVAA